MEVKRDLRIDALRFIAMVGVVLFHFGEMWWGEKLFFPNNINEFWRIWSSLSWNPLWLIALIGDHGVPIFLFISSYAISKCVKRNDLWWWLNRFKQILLPYWLAVMFGSILIWISWRLAPDFLDRLVIQEFGWNKLIISGLLLQNWSREWFNSPNPAWWFVPILVQGYVLIFLWRIVENRIRLNKWLSLSGILMIQFLVFITSLVIRNDLFMFVYYSGLNYVSVIGLGYWWGKYETRLKVDFGVVLLIVGWYLRFLTLRYFKLSEAFIGFGWWLVWVSMSSNWNLERLASWGKRYSYWVYLWHLPIIYFVVSLAIRVMKIDR